MYGICKVNCLIIGQRIQHVFIHCDEFGLFGYIGHARQGLGLAIFKA